MPRDRVPETHQVRLVTRYQEAFPDIFRRALLVLFFVAVITVIVWADRDGLMDEADPGRPPGLVDVFYFTMVTLTTVGYGDIVPVSPSSRLISALIVTPIRVIILIIFIGTAYQLAIQRYQEAYQMRKVQERLKNHVIICGYGVKGHATVAELLSFGRSRDDIVVIDPKPDAIEDAAADGLVALKADATTEAALKAAAIDKAAVVVVDVDRDDSTVLICLTAKHLNPNVCLVAAAREAENVPLIYRSGADVVVAPPMAGGRMLAIATEYSHAPRFIEDMLTFGRGLDLGEREITQSEAGLTAGEIPDLADKLPIGAYHREQRYAFDKLKELRLEPGDVVIYLVSKQG